MEKMKKATKQEISSSIKNAQSKGYVVTSSMSAHISNEFKRLFNDEFYMKENDKTDRIPVFSIPNIVLQAEFLKVYKNNKEKFDAIVPTEEKEAFENFIEYLKNNAMCVNCSSCMKDCYNNKAYTQYPTKAVCDLRQLYRMINKPLVVASEIVQETINSKNVRLNGSGEIHNQFILDIYTKVAKMNPDTIYFTYTKNFSLLANKKLPKNLIINVSDFGTTELVKEYKESFQKNTNIFKAVTKNEFKDLEKNKCKTLCYGVSCSTCRLCTKKKGIEIFCAIH